MWYKKIRDLVRDMKQKEKKYFDYNLLVIVICLIGFGLIMIYSASSYECSLLYEGDSAHYLKKQFLATCVGILPMLIVIKFDYGIFKRKFMARGAALVAIFMLLLIFSPLAYEANGAKRWIAIPFFSIQVCEVVKVCLIIYMAYFLNKKGKYLADGNVFIMAIGLIGVPTLGVLLITSDLSSAVIIAAIGFIMLFVACPKKIFFVPIAIGGAFLGGLFILLASYRMERVKVWLHNEKYSDEGGFQVLQSLYALGSGGFFGKGLGNSVQKLGNIPESQNDMIFTVVCEELGIVGGIAVLIMFSLILYRIAVVALNARDRFGLLICTGVFAHIAVQTLINIAVVTNTMPNTGVPLPFMSYGGSSVMFLMIEIGLVLSVSRHIPIRE